MSVALHLYLALNHSQKHLWWADAGKTTKNNIINFNKATVE